MSKSDIIIKCVKAGLVVGTLMFVVGMIGSHAQDPNNINPQDGSIGSIAIDPEWPSAKQVWGEIPYCPNADDLGFKSTRTELWTDGCTLRWNKPQLCFECL